MTAEEKLVVLEHLAIRARERDRPLSPLEVLDVIQGRVNGMRRPVHLSHDVPRGSGDG